MLPTVSSHQPGAQARRTATPIQGNSSTATAAASDNWFGLVDSPWYRFDLSVSASVLWEMSEAMEVPVAYFYEGFGAGPERQSPDSPHAPSLLFETNDGFELAQAFLQLPEGPVRKVVVNLARQLAALPIAH